MTITDDDDDDNDDDATTGATGSITETCADERYCSLIVRNMVCIAKAVVIGDEGGVGDDDDGILPSLFSGLAGAGAT